MVYYVYMLKCISEKINKTYVGYTNNLILRLNKHNSGKGAKSTRGLKWEIIYKKKINIIAQIHENNWNNKKTIQLNIRDLIL